MDQFEQESVCSGRSSPLEHVRIIRSASPCSSGNRSPSPVGPVEDLIEIIHFVMAMSSIYAPPPRHQCEWIPAEETDDTTSQQQQDSSSSPAHQQGTSQDNTFISRPLSPAQSTASVVNDAKYKGLKSKYNDLAVCYNNKCDRIKKMKEDIDQQKAEIKQITVQLAERDTTIKRLKEELKLKRKQLEFNAGAAL